MMPVRVDWLRDYAGKEGILIGWCSPQLDPEVAELLAERREQGLQAPFVRWSPEERTDPWKLLSQAKSIISIALPYETGIPKPETGVRGRLARFSWGQDYHLMVRSKLEALARLCEIRLDAKVFAYNVDTGPLVDRYWAVKTGLGVFGKNTAIITKEFGSWVVLGELLLDVVLPPERSGPVFGKEYCGECARCLTVCPTGAIEAPYLVNPHKCLSYLTQKKGVFPREYRERMGDRLYGCDACQAVCPRNREMLSDSGDRVFSDEERERAYPDLDTVLGLSKKQFRQMFGDTACGWRGKSVIQRNALVACGNLGHISPAVYRAAESENSNLRAHACWALAKSGNSKAKDYLYKKMQRENDTMVLEELNWCFESLLK